MTPPESSAEIKAIRTVLAQQRQRNEGSGAGQSAYADDADWLNAFGVRQKGAADIEAWYRRMLAGPAFASAQLTMQPSDIRFIRPDVAVVHTTFEVIGQRTRSGQEMPPRRGHQFRVMTKEQGRWVIAWHVIMDEKEALP